MRTFLLKSFIQIKVKFLFLFFVAIALQGCVQKKSNNDIKIGRQYWSSKNLNVSKFKNGEIIKEAKTNEDWVLACNSKIPVWCYYENKTANGQIYGKLYNWYAVIDSRGLAPKGYHIPTFSEWDLLSNFLGVAAAPKMKSKSGWKENGNGVNESGFNALPGGFRFYNGNFYYIGINSSWWSFPEKNSNTANDFNLYSASASVYRYKYSTSNVFGFSVRCIKD